MADLNIKCQCGQDLVCDSAYAGQQVQCPYCQALVTVPKPAASSEPNNPLVPKVPEKTKLAIGTKETHGKGAAAQASHPMNLRKPTAPPKKKLPIKEIGTYVAIVAFLGVGGYFGYDYWKKKQAATEAAEAPPPAAAPANPDGSAAAPSEGTPGAEAAATEAPQPKPEKALPIIPPTYSMDAAIAKIPQSKLNGTITGGEFVPETARLEQTPSSQVLRFTQGALPTIDRELIIYLKMKYADLTNGHSVSIASDTRGSGLPQIVKKWRANPNSRYAPVSKTFGYGYVLKLELEKAVNGQLPGKLYVALPDKEESVVAGVFSLTLPSTDPNQAPAQGIAPTAIPTGGSPAEQEAFRRRYGGAR
jgi:hypothetical protein